ncbi:Fis family transcriptional regulator [Vibrio ponticus]|uniref:Fis family transcriptional regulator n=1 Tax=Vibrio ponticus TaxID=265668 RepID=A0ABX3FLN9_9VIBR|nr:AraC family transcriptional regulator [Vibrio ponticus]OLQ93974.1 Fis family transcriptional regulator [Vibrio ponticus]
MKTTEFSIQLPIFWFKTFDAALKRKFGESRKFWGDDEQYQALCLANSVSAYQLEHAVAQVYQCHGEELIECFSLTAEHFDEIELGAPVLAMLTAPTLTRFCELLCRYSIHIHPLLKLICRETEQGELELWTVTHEFVDEITLVSHLSLGLYLSVILKLIRSYCKNANLRLPIHINRITIDKDVTPQFERIFNVEVRTGYPARYFLFSKALVDKTHRQFDPNLHEQLQLLAEKQTESVAQSSFLYKVNKVLQSKEVNMISLESVAAELNMSPRTLNRRLQQEGVSFRRLYDKYRLEQSLKMLNQDNLSVTYIAHELGFSDSSAFSRAFKRWTGESPKQKVS